VVVGALARLLAHRLPDRFDRRAALVPLAGGVVALVGLAQPFFYYPDVDTHAKLLDAIAETPSLALDPRPYQERTSAWTRSIAGRRVAFPYSTAFHVLALPLRPALGAVAAVKTVACLALALTLLLAHRLGRGGGPVPARRAVRAGGRAAPAGDGVAPHARALPRPLRPGARAGARAEA